MIAVGLDKYDILKNKLKKLEVYPPHHLSLGFMNGQNVQATCKT